MRVLDRGHGVRLRTTSLAEYERCARSWYRDPEVLRFSEAGSQPYGPEELRAMFEALSRKGELYLIEHAQQPVGDAALLPDDVSLVIGRPDDRSRGIGTEALQLLIMRARELGWHDMHVAQIHPENVRSHRLFARAGFEPTANGTLRKQLTAARA
jgi:RimJ/RimL family protein N-acetyltransferase